jgi:hypothetical protein
MLNEEMILKNYERFMKGSQKYGFACDKLFELLGKEFIEAPASTKLDRHNAFKGGLVDHILRVTEIALKINKSLPLELQSSTDSLVKVGFLHQIGKAKLYKPNPSEWHKEKLGEMYVYDNELTPLSVGERSIFIIKEAGINLTIEEYQAILNFSKPYEDKQALYFTCNLGEVLSQAIEWAIREEKLINNK